MIGNKTPVVIVLWMGKGQGRELFIVNSKKGALDMESKIRGFNFSFPTYDLCNLEANHLSSLGLFL